jgi:hypothetical protein
MDLMHARSIPCSRLPSRLLGRSFRYTALLWLSFATVAAAGAPAARSSARWGEAGAPAARSSARWGEAGVPDARCPARLGDAGVPDARVPARWGEAGNRIVADLNGDGRADRIRILDTAGQRALIVHFAGGPRILLRTPWRVRRLVAGDVDRDGDVDLLGTTEGAELVAWINHGRGRFALAERRAPPVTLLACAASGIHRGYPEPQIDPGVITSDATTTTTRSMPMPGIARTSSQYFEPDPLTLQSAPVSPRGPPQA